MKSAVLGCCLLALAMSGQAVAGVTLITPQEAALPPAPSTASVALLTRALTRRPEVILVSPTATVTSPFSLQFKFKAHGGSTIKPDTFHLIYVKDPTVDLTARVKPYLTENGIEMDGAEVPPGRHMLKATISDSDNREGSAVFVINVLK